MATGSRSFNSARSAVLTRQLADVAQNIVITSEDCGTSKGITKVKVDDGHGDSR